MSDLKRKQIFSTFIVCFVMLYFVVGGGDLRAQKYIADYSVSKEGVLRSIPEWAIEAAKDNLHILYVGTSHSSQTVDGMRGLMEYKTGDNSLYSVTFNGTPVDGSLDIHYRGASGTDLSNDSVDGDGHTGYYYGTIAYLDTHADVNVVMWSWCSIEGHNVQIYLDNFGELIDMYRAGGSKGRTAANEVKFVFMTGYARGSDGDTPEPPYIRSPYQNYKRIIDYCNANGYFCLDYWSQDTYEYETDAYKPTESGNDNVQHLAYTNSHTVGEDWFYCRSYSSGSIQLPAHANQHLTGNRRAYGAWWVWARLAGWDGNTENPCKTDFNGDGKEDILWRYYGSTSSGVNMVWTMDGTTRIGDNIWIKRMADSNWKIGGTGDFDGDGKTDILWRNYGNDANKGRNVVWYMDGTSQKGNEVQLQRLVDLDWKIEGVGDFNGDGKPDILWRYYGASSTGINMVWYMDGVTRSSGNLWLRRLADPDWKIEGTGDFNSDGKTDILWRYYGTVSTGINMVWYMDGVSRIGGPVWLRRNADPDWQIAGVGDYSGDGKCDILWRYYGTASSGLNMLWQMDGINRVGSNIWMRRLVNIDWKIEN
jgi:hypothetical protein